MHAPNLNKWAIERAAVGAYEDDWNLNRIIKQTSLWDFLLKPNESIKFI